MNLAEYAGYDALGLAELVAKKQMSAKELAKTAVAAKEKVDPTIKSVVELYPDRIDGLDEKSLGNGPFRGVPFLIKDVFGHEKGRKIEFGSRLCEGMTVEADTHFAELLRASGVNILGRSAAPEYSMSSTTESAMFGNTSNPWKQGYSAGGSTGGGQAAVLAGIVPIAHGSDIGGSIRIPASWCGGVGLKPSRMRVSSGPVVDEGGWGYSMNFVQTRTVRDAAAMLDCVAIPQPGDPFIIPKPDEPYAALTKKAPGKLKVGIVLNELVGMKVDPEVVAAVEATGKTLAGMGHAVEQASADMGGREALVAAFDVFFFGFDARLDGYAKRTGHKPGPDTLEPVISRRLRGGQGDHADAIHRRPQRRQQGPPQARSLLQQVRYLALAHDLARGRALGPLSPVAPGQRLGRPDRAAVQAALPVHHPAQHHGHAGDVAAAGDALLGRADRRADRCQARRRPSGAAAGRSARAGDAVEGPRAAAARLEDVRGLVDPSRRYSGRR